jgi:hypothetical protein
MPMQMPIRLAADLRQHIGQRPARARGGLDSWIPALDIGQYARPIDNGLFAPIPCGGDRPKNVPERLRHRYAGRGQLTVLSAVLAFLTLRDIAPPPKQPVHEFIFTADKSDDEPVCAELLRSRVRGLARQVAMDEKDGLDLERYKQL